MLELHTIAIPNKAAPRRPKYQFDKCTDIEAINCGKYSKSNRLRVAAAAYQWNKKHGNKYRFILRKVNREQTETLYCWKVLAIK